MNIDDIKDPSQIRGLDIAALTDIAAQMRAALLNRTSKKGGHVGPNLGIVETAIALHYVFDTPEDKIVWDVSHQAYPHKMLTGRARAYTHDDRFGDVSGYTDPAESPYDLFTVGHTSTSVSLATGLAKARDLKGRHNNIIAVIGDGSLSGGEAFEGLDTAATLDSNFIVVVNDNDMSIAENHGGIYRDLRLLRTTRGEAPVNIFRAMGFEYRFVADGNDLTQLIAAFKEVKDTDRPVVVHVCTQKGHGYAPAVADKESWHWQPPFDIATGHVYADDDKTETYASLTARFLLDKMQRDPRVVVLSAGTPMNIGFNPAQRALAGKHFVDVGIAEEQAAAMSAGLAKGGMRPVWGVASTFVQRAYDQISQEIAINNAPAVILDVAGGLGALTDVTHLCWFDIALLSNIPGIVMLAPTCLPEYTAMLDWAINQTDHPVVIRTPNVAPATLPIETDTDFSDIDTFSQVRAGHGVAIIAAGHMMGAALQAADILKRDHGISPTVINPRFVSGIDAPMLSALSEDHRAVITVEDGQKDGGFGQKIAAFYADRPMAVRNLGLPKQFMDRYDPAQLARQCHLTPEGIAARAVEMFK